MEHIFLIYDDNDCYFGPQLVVIIGREPDPILVDIDIIQPNCNSDPEWSFNNGSICILLQAVLIQCQLELIGLITVMVTGV